MLYKQKENSFFMDTSLVLLGAKTQNKAFSGGQYFEMCFIWTPRQVR